VDPLSTVRCSGAEARNQVQPTVKGLVAREGRVLPVEDGDGHIGHQESKARLEWSRKDFFDDENRVAVRV